MISKMEHKPDIKRIDEYIDIMRAYMLRHMVKDVVRLGRAIMIDLLSIDYDDDNILTFCSFMMLMAEAQGQCISTEEETNDLLYAVDNAFYFDENCVENFDENFTGQILRKKSRALDRLSRSEFLSDDIKDTCFCRAEECIDKAVEIFAAHPGDPQNCIQYIDVLWDKTIMRICKESYALTRQRIIAFLHQLSDIDDNKLQLRAYNLVTEELFNTEYNPEWLMVIRENGQNMSDDVRNEVYGTLLEEHLSSDGTNYLSKIFTHAVSPAERQTILIVDDILEAAHVDFDKIQQVFTTTLIPHDITFNGGKHPIAGMIYSINPADSTDYLTYQPYDYHNYPVLGKKHDNKTM